MANGPTYDVDRAGFAELLLRTFYPERTTQESGIIRDFLQEHLAKFDRVSFSVRIGQGATPDPTHLPGIQRSTVYSSQKRIDVVCYEGANVWLVEAKTRVGHAVMGQLLSDRQLWLEDHPNEPEPRLVAIGRTTDDDSTRVLNAHGIDVFIYEAAPSA